MAQNITIMGASYSDVPAVTLPKTGGGTASFDDTTDADATAGEIAQGKTAYVNGIKVSGSAISRTSSDLTVSGATVTTPAGYYASQAFKTVASGSVTAPATITGEATTGAAGTLAMANPQLRLVELTQSVSVTPDVTTAGYITNGTAGTSTIKTYAQIAGLINNTFTPTTTDQVIASNGNGFYFVGAAKVAGDADLVAENIKKDVSIFGVTGTYEGSGGTDFVVTISYNSATNMWEPDCTFAEVQAAVNAGKTIVATGTNIEEESVDCAWKSAGTPRLEYYVRDYVAGTRDTIIESYYRFASGGLVLVYSEPFIVPTGTKTLTSKGTHSVTDYANAKVEATDITGGTITPTTTSQTIASAAGLYNITAALDVAGDANLIPANIANGVSIFGVTGTHSGGYTLLGSLSLGTISTSSTTATNTGQSITVQGINNYDLLVCECSVATITNGRHAATTRLIWLTASSSIGTKSAATILGSTLNIKVSSSGVATSRANATAYGVYAYSCSLSNGSATISIYQRYNSTQTGTINGSYTMRVYGVKIYDLIGG